MKKTILITGSTDGIGLAGAIKLAAAGRVVALHGRSATKLAAAKAQVGEQHRCRHTHALGCLRRIR